MHNNDGARPACHWYRCVMWSPDPIPVLKQHVTSAIVAHLKAWTQEMAAELIRTDQPRVSDLRNGRLERFSLEQLIRFATRLGADVTVAVTWDPRKRRFNSHQADEV